MSISRNKEVVRRFNLEVIVGGSRAAFDELMCEKFVNRSALPGQPCGPESMWNTFHSVLRPALGDLSVTIHDQLGEGDKVTTRKTISGVHVGNLLGVAPTGKPISIEVIDVVRVEEGRYAEHWGLNTLSAAVAALSQ